MIAALIVGVVIVLVIVLLVVYRVRTGSWFKLKSRDEKGMEFKFHKALLIDDMKSAKKKVTCVVACVLHSVTVGMCTAQCDSGHV